MGSLTVHAEARRARRKPGDRDGDGGSRPGEIRAGIKNGPRGRRKPLKRLDSDKESKVNSKENRRILQAIPMIFRGFSRPIKGFPKDAKLYATAKGVQPPLARTSAGSRRSRSRPASRPIRSASSAAPSAATSKRA